MSDTDNAQAGLSPAVGQQLDSWLGGHYGGCIDTDTFCEIEDGLAGALESEGVLFDDVREVVRRDGFGHFDRAIAQRLAAEAIAVARRRG